MSCSASLLHFCLFVCLFLSQHLPPNPELTSSTMLVGRWDPVVCSSLFLRVQSFLRDDWYPSSGLHACGTHFINWVISAAQAGVFRQESQAMAHRDIGGYREVLGVRVKLVSESRRQSVSGQWQGLAGSVSTGVFCSTHGRHRLYVTAEHWAGELKSYYFISVILNTNSPRWPGIAIL